MRGGGRHKDKKSTAVKNIGNLDNDDRRCSKPGAESGGDRQQEGQVDQGFCAWACEQVRSIKEMTSEAASTVEKFE